MLLMSLLAFVAASIVTTDARVSEDHFLVRNTADLVQLCSAMNSDLMDSAARGFCYGFAVAEFRMLWAEDIARKSNHLLCVPSPQPTRDEVLAGFVDWAKANPAQSLRPATEGFQAFIKDEYGCVRPR